MKVTWKVQRFRSGTRRWRAEAHGCRVIVIEFDPDGRPPWIYVSVHHIGSKLGVMETGLPADVPAAKRRALKLARRLEREAAR